VLILLIAGWANGILDIATATYVATAAFTAALGLLTCKLVVETTALREQSAAIAKDAQIPLVIIYTDLDEQSSLAKVIVENASDNPAFDLELRFDPDIWLQWRKKAHDGDRMLSDLLPSSIDVLPPRQKIARTFGVFSTLDGDYGPIPQFVTTAEIAFSSASGNRIVRKAKLTTAATRKQFYVEKGTPTYRNKIIERAGRDIAKAISGLRTDLRLLVKETDEN
jgi:hypothetical protein